MIKKEKSRLKRFGSILRIFCLFDGIEGLFQRFFGG